MQGWKRYVVRCVTAFRYLHVLSCRADAPEGCANIAVLVVLYLRPYFGFVQCFTNIQTTGEIPFVAQQHITVLQRQRRAL